DFHVTGVRRVLFRSCAHRASGRRSSVLLNCEWAVGVNIRSLRQADQIVHGAVEALGLTGILVAQREPGLCGHPVGGVRVASVAERSKGLDQKADGRGECLILAAFDRHLCHPSRITTDISVSNYAPGRGETDSRSPVRACGYSASRP